MCFVSIVMDDYTRRFTDWTPNTTQPATTPLTWTTTTPVPTVSPEEVKELRKLIAEFREAVKLAKKLDEVTKQPDCEDPAKAQLEDRVAALEKRLDAIGKALSP
jgi:hypothetical protein